jgi:hypothetical protein
MAAQQRRPTKWKFMEAMTDIKEVRGQWQQRMPYQVEVHGEPHGFFDFA